jgi:hypothetical protein
MTTTTETKMTMPGFTAEVTLREGLQRNWARHERPQGKDRGVTPQLFCRSFGDRICCWGDNYYGCHYIVQ